MICSLFLSSLSLLTKLKTKNRDEWAFNFCDVRGDVSLTSVHGQITPVIALRAFSPVSYNSSMIQV